MKQSMLSSILAVGLCTVAMVQSNADDTASVSNTAQSPSIAESDANSLEKTPSKSWSVSFTTEALSDYVLGGQIYSDTPVSQNSLTLGYSFDEFGSAYVNFWTSHFLTHKGSPSKGLATQEIVYSISYSYDMGPLTLSLGNSWYTYPNQPYGSTEEIVFSVTYNNPYVTPTVTAYWDYLDTYGNDTSAVYIDTNLAHTFEITEKFSCTPMLVLGLADGAYAECYSYGAVNSPEFADFSSVLKFAYAINQNLSVGAMLKYTFLPSHTLRHNDYMGNGKHQLLYGGFNVTLNF